MTGIIQSRNKNDQSNLSFLLELPVNYFVLYKCVLLEYNHRKFEAAEYGYALLSFLGCLFRMCVSKLNNLRVRTIKLYSLIGNIFAESICSIRGRTCLKLKRRRMTQ